jgi:hypothetical protein
MTTATARPYIFNLETGKIELHFDKAEYQSLPEVTKKELKSAFLFSGRTGAWVSRSKEPNLYRAKQVAAKLGFTQEHRQGERLSFAEQVERQAERAEARAERFEGYADNAERRAEGLQKEFNSHRGDIAFFTQPIIAGHSGSQAFARRRERIYARYDKGFEEYRKSEYFRDRAATAQNTADMKKFKDPVYLDNRIKECKKNIRAMEKNIVRYEEIIYSLENATEERPSIYAGRYTIEQVSEWIENQLERIEAEVDKQGYMENCLDAIGGNKFSKDNIKPGYIVRMIRWGRCEIISTGPVNVTFKILDGGASGGVLTEAYAAIAEIIEAKEVENKIENPFKEGDILCKHRPADNSIYQAYQVVKVTKTGVKIQQIEVKEGKPLAGQFISNKVMQKKIVKSKWSDFVGVYHDDWQLHKYTV